MGFAQDSILLAVSMLWIEVTVNRPSHDKAWGDDYGGSDRLGKLGRLGSKGKPAFRQA